MSKTIKAIITSFSLLIVILIIVPFAINTSALKFQLEQKISQKLDTNFQIKGKVSVVFLPLPKVIANQILVSKLIVSNSDYTNNVQVKHLIIRPDIFSLFGNHIKINKIIFDGLKVENKHSVIIDAANTNPKKDQKTNDILTGQPESKANISNVHGKTFANTIFGFENGGDKVFDFKNIKTIEIIDGNFIRKNSDNQDLLEFSKINCDIKNNFKKQIFTIEGSFLSQNMPTQFKLIANTNKNKDSSFIIQSPIIQLSASGKFNNSDINDLVRSNFSGQLNVEILDLKALLNRYFPKNNLLYKKINPTQPIKISGQINNKEGEIKISDIIINSQLMDGTGQIQANFSIPKPNIDASFNFNNIDIDSIWFSGAPEKNDSTSSNFENQIIQEFVNQNNQNGDKTIIINNQNNNQNNTISIFNNLDLTTEINIKTTKYLGANLQDVRLYFIISDNGDVLLQPLTAKIPGNATLNVEGAIKNQNEIPKFIGTINIDGKNLEQLLSWLKFDLKSLKPNSLSNYNFNASLLMLPNFAIFSGLNLNINNGKNIITGDIKNGGSSNYPSVSANLKVNHFNYDDYFNQNNTQSQFLSGGSLLKKLLWLNTINYTQDISLFFNQLVYQNHSFTNQALRVKFGQGFLKINDFNLSSPNLDIKGDIEFDISKTIPKININLNSNNITHYSTNQANSEFTDQFFNLPSMDEFSGKVAINIANLAIDNWKAGDVKISGDMKDGIVNFDNFTLKAYGGNATYKGLIAFKSTKTIKGVLELIGVSNQNLLNDIIGFDNISGISNIASVIEVSTDKKSNFFKNLGIQAQFISANIAVKSYGIFDLAKEMLRPVQYRSNLEQPLNILYNPNSQSFFKDIKGAVSISGNKTQTFNIEASAVGMNGVISGSLDLERQAIDGAANFIFISGTRQKQIPINVATNFTGKAGALKQNTNLTQVQQYLQSVGIE